MYCISLETFHSHIFLITLVRRPHYILGYVFPDFEEMASCPSNLYCVGGDEQMNEDYHLGRSQTVKSVLFTTYKDEAKATVIKTDGMTHWS